MPRRLVRPLLVAASVLLPLSAMAFTTATTRALNVRSGPGTSFRVLTVLPARAQLRVHGCMPGWRWCDISARRDRGWVDSRYLQHSVRGRVPIVNDRGRPHGPSQPNPWPQRPAG